MEEIGKWGNDGMDDNESGVSLGVNGYGMDIGMQTCKPVDRIGRCQKWVCVGIGRI